MTTRKILASATLAALPLVVGAMQAGPPRGAADAARTRHAIERPSGPQWTYATWGDLEMTAFAAGFTEVVTGCWLSGVAAAL